MNKFLEIAKDALIKAGMAALVAFVTVLLQSLGLPAPDPDSFPDIVGANAEAMQAVSAAANDATLKTAISIPTILFFIDLGLKLFGVIGKEK